MFLASTLFLKRAERIMALLFVMTLCLLVYAATWYRIRKVLAENEAVVPDQIRRIRVQGKPTKRPTARWVFELFLDVHLLFITQQGVQVLVMNLKDQFGTASAATWGRLLQGLFVILVEGGRKDG